METAGKLFDPFGFTQVGSEKTLAWYRAAELKHGRVAMLASLGIAYTCSGGPLFGGNIALDGTTFASLGKDPWAAFAAMPTSGKIQMLVVIGAFGLPPGLSTDDSSVDSVPQYPLYGSLFPHLMLNSI